jgi:hypothetical protein
MHILKSKTNEDGVWIEVDNIWTRANNIWTREVDGISSSTPPTLSP